VNSSLSALGEPAHGERRSFPSGIKKQQEVPARHGPL
jgi:hypothetical protein